MESLLSRQWHAIADEEVARLLETDPERGLDLLQLDDRRERFGPNALRPRERARWLKLLAAQIHQPLVYILIAAGVVTAVLQEWVDAGVIFGVVVVNAVIGFVQESKAVRAIEALARSMSTEATVVRAGVRRRVSSVELVPGDVVLLASGDRVPADLRLLRARELRVDESALTGESVPVSKQPGRLPKETSLADRTNMAYSSALVTHGTATGLVVGTGHDTEIGRIEQLIATAEILATPLTRKIASFSRVLLVVILALAGVTFAVGALRGEALFSMFMATVALAVGAIPEGLPAAVTITLAIGVAKMARRNAIVRRLPAVETLGSTTVICSDKTGTLTQNQMTVQEIVTEERDLRVSGVGYAIDGSFSEAEEAVDPSDDPVLRELLLAGALCNDARLAGEGKGARIEGDPTEGALLVVARKAGIVEAEVERALPRVDTLPFESEHQYMATLHAREDGSRVVYVKGSVERVVARCERAMTREGEAPLDAAKIHERADEVASRGLRVLALARRAVPPETREVHHEDVRAGLTFLGLVAMIDPPRPEAVEAVRACQSAGIRVKMITGDHAHTASAIAAQIGLEGAVDASGRLVTITGRELAELHDDELIERAHRTAVFARVAPEQKLRLVAALQAPHVHSHVVAMTGDGVNDAPALRRADIGIAMGLGGTEVAKEAADMVLADDNFSSIEAAVEEGRGVYDNLVKFITWTLPTNLGEGLVVLVAVMAGLRLPILPVQILWINMTTAVLLGLMLAFEPKEPGIMERPPRDPRTPILTGELVLRIVIVGLLLLAGSFGLFEWELARGESLAEARTAAANVFVFGEMTYLFNCRSLRRSMFSLGLFTNRWLLGGVALMTVLQLAFTYVPAMNVAFGTAPIDGQTWALIAGVGAVVYAVVGTEKWLRRTLARRSERPRRPAAERRLEATP